MNTPKEVFTFIRDEEGYLESELFICIAVNTLEYKSKIGESLRKECRNLLEENKPQDNSFIGYIYWKGGYVWWHTEIAKLEGKINEVLSEKRRFLTYLIEKL